MAGGWPWQAQGAARILGICRAALLVAGFGLASWPSAGQTGSPGTDTPIANGTAAEAPPRPLRRARSLWVPASWGELQGLGEDALHEAWSAWVRSCEKPPSAFSPLCPDIRRLSIGSPGEQLGWMMERLQPYRIEPLEGAREGLLTGYFEPWVNGSRTRQAPFETPLHRLPAMARKPWFSREEIDTLPAAQAALRGRELVFIQDPVDALMLQIQGSGRIRLADESRTMRIAYAGANDHPYRSVGRWLLDRGELRDASWPAIRAWAQANPGRVQEMLWSNPRVVFFREETVGALPADAGPRGAQGVPLTPGRSIAVDPGSIPYGTPVWLSSSGETATLNRLVIAQDTGSAIVGAVRADYFAGSGPQAGELAGRLKQPLQLWALWPKQSD